MAYNAKHFEMTDGTIVDNIDSINELSDVNITTPADGNIFEYDSNSNKWVNKEHIKNPYVVIDYTSIGTIELTDSTTSVNLGAPVHIYGYTSENENREVITISELFTRVQKGANVVLQIPFSQGAGRFWLSNIQYDASIMSGNKYLYFNGVVHMETNGHNYECEVSIDSQNNLYTLTVKSIVDTVENDFIIFEAGQSITSATELQRIYKLLQRGKMPFFKTTNMMILPLDSYMCSKSGVSIPLTTTISEFAKMTHPTSSPYDMIVLVFYQKAGSGTAFQATSKSIQLVFNGTTLNGITVLS